MGECVMGIYRNEKVESMYGLGSWAASAVCEKVRVAESAMAAWYVSARYNSDCSPSAVGVEKFLRESYMLLRYVPLGRPETYKYCVIYDPFLNEFCLKNDDVLVYASAGLDVWRENIISIIDSLTVEVRELGVRYFEENPLYLELVDAPAYALGVIKDEVEKVYKSDLCEFDIETDNALGGMRVNGKLYVKRGSELIEVLDRQIVYTDREKIYFPEGITARSILR